MTVAALSVLEDEKLAENAERLGEIFRERMRAIQQKTTLIETVRGKGLLNAIVIATDEESPLAWKICLQLKEKGLLCKQTHGNKIRFAPPLVITESQIQEACDLIEEVILGV